MRAVHLRSRILQLFLAAASLAPPLVADAATDARQKAGEADYAAAFVSQSVPPFIELFGLTAVSITMRNTGTATWLAAEGDVFLAAQEPQDNYYWCVQDNPHGMYGGNRVLLPHDVAPGETVSFDFVVKPLSCGFSAQPPFRFRMLSQLFGTFGEETPDPRVYVSTAAEFVAQQAPDIAPAGAKLRVVVSFRNTTNVRWSPADGYALAPAGPAGDATWGVTAVALAESVDPGEVATFTFTIDIPQTPGAYDFRWQMTSMENVPFGQASPATPVTVVAARPPNYGGLCGAAPAGSEAGWGINLAHQGDVIFATWFTYDAAGNPLWLSMTADKTSEGNYAGTLVQAIGPAFDIVPFRAERVRLFDVGTGTLSFEATASPFDAKDGTFAYTLNGVPQSKAITRQVFGPLPTCTFALQADLTRAYNYQDIWWAAPDGSEPGWGINLTHQGDIIFATWFTYGEDGLPTWFSVTAPRSSDGSYAGTLYRTAGPAFDAPSFDPSRVVLTAVGTAKFAFTNGSAGTFSWSVDAASGSESITRQVFGTPGTMCQ